jgi:ketosteroid isomerase-like protein
MTTGLKSLDMSEIEGFSRVFEDLFNRGDFLGMAAFYSDDAHLLSENTPVVQGRRSIERFWEEACKRSGVKERTIEVRHIESSGDLGYVLGAVTLKIQSAVDQIVTVTVNYVTVWKREMSGVWRLVVDISTRQPAA